MAIFKGTWPKQGALSTWRGTYAHKGHGGTMIASQIQSRHPDLPNRARFTGAIQAVANTWRTEISQYWKDAWRGWLFNWLWKRDSPIPDQDYVYAIASSLSFADAYTDLAPLIPTPPLGHPVLDYAIFEAADSAHNILYFTLGPRDVPDANAANQFRVYMIDPHPRFTSQHIYRTRHVAHYDDTDYRDEEISISHAAPWKIYAGQTVRCLLRYRSGNTIQELGVQEQVASDWP